MNSTASEAIGQLFCGVLFFGMRSCEYTSAGETRPRTKKLTVGDIIFFNKEGRELTSDRSNTYYVKITFRNQKNSEKMKFQTRVRDSKNSELCPVKIWAKIVDHILSYSGTSSATPMQTVLINNRKM